MINLKKVQSDLSSLKSKVHKLDIGKLETTPDDLSKLSDAVKNEVVKKLNIMNQLQKLIILILLIIVI